MTAPRPKFLLIARLLPAEEIADDERAELHNAEALFNTEYGAQIDALTRISRWVNGDWKWYEPARVERMRDAVGMGEYELAIQIWNDMAIFRVTIKELIAHSEVRRTPDMKWPKEET